MYLKIKFVRKYIHTQFYFLQIHQGIERHLSMTFTGSQVAILSPNISGKNRMLMSGRCYDIGNETSGSHFKQFAPSVARDFRDINPLCPAPTSMGRPLMCWQSSCILFAGKAQPPVFVVGKHQLLWRRAEEMEEGGSRAGDGRLLCVGLVIRDKWRELESGKHPLIWTKKKSRVKIHAGNTKLG